MKLMIIILIVAAAVSFSHAQMEPGILIVGGQTTGFSTLSSAEMFLPGLTCSVGDMPEGRFEASLCHGLVCGGYLGNDRSSLRTCENLSLEMGPLHQQTSTCRIEQAK